MKRETSVKLIRVLIVEDSPVYRELLVTILHNASGFQVVGTARNGLEAVRLARRLAPDLVVMDIDMPEMDGIEAARKIMEETPCPIVMISAGLSKAEQETSLRAGALSVLAKPLVSDPAEHHHRLAHQLRLMSEVRVVRRWGEAAAASSSRTKARPGAAVLSTQPAETPLIYTRKSAIRLVAMASSTGGPGVLAGILSRLPVNFPVPILIVQHITAGFGEELAAWLNQQTPLQVRLARHADEPQPGQVLLAPDNAHIRVNGLGLITLSQHKMPHGICPSADYLFHSTAEVYGPLAVGVILTGMGSDGAEGLQALRQTGAHTIAQDQESSIVFGMPAVAIGLGAAEQILPAGRIAPALLALLGISL